MRWLAGHWRTMSPRAAAWLPVLACLLAVAVLGSARVSGSSVSLYGDGSPTAGQARPIRSDEYLVRTPLVVRQAEAGFPDTTLLGNGRHSTGVLSDLPVSGWPNVLRPQTVPYHLFDVERAFAFEWWLVVVAPFLGVYWFVLAVSRRVGLAMLAGLAVMLAPAVVWWAIPSTGTSIGFAAAAGAALVEAGRARRRTTAAVLGAVTGWLLACLATVLYVPWVLGMALAVLPAACVCWSMLRRTGAQVPWWYTLAPLVAVAAALVFAFLARHRDTLAAIGATVYPGDRRSASGEVDPALLLAAPFDWFTTRLPLVGVSGTNQSEAASGFAMWLPVLVAHTAVLTWWRAEHVVRRAAAAVAAAVVVMLVWAFVPLPAFVGKFTMLDRIPAERLYQPLLVAGVLLAVFVAAAHREQPLIVAPWRAVVAVSATAGVTLWAGLVMRIDGQSVDRLGVVAFTSVSAVAVALLVSGRMRAGLAVIVALSAFSAVRVNPVQVGLGPLLDAPLRAQIAAVAPEAQRAVWLEEGEADDADGVLAASGVSLLSGLSWYPDEEAWLRIDPDRSYEQVWNRLAHVRFALRPDSSPVVMNLPYPDVIVVSGGVCSEGIRALEPGVVVTPQPMDVPCLEQLDPAPRRPGELLIYRYLAD